MFYKYWLRTEITVVSLNSLLIIHDSQPIYMLPPYGTTISNVCVRGVINVFAMVWVQYECSLKVLVPRIVVPTSTKSLKEVESSGQCWGHWWCAWERNSGYSKAAPPHLWLLMCFAFIFAPIMSCPHKKSKLMGSPNLQNNEPEKKPLFTPK